jgi:5-deoxy-glucuronate isomerase
MRKHPLTLLHSRALKDKESGARIGLTPKRAGWDRIGFAVHQIAGGQTWSGRTGSNEVCLVLLSGLATATWNPGGRRSARLGPRGNVFSDYPHAVYLPPGTTFALRASRLTEIAVCQSPSDRSFPARLIPPEECGLEVRGGGNATRQIIDILPPSSAADRLLVCEVLTPAGNWSSYPPHKHDVHRPPVEVDLEETYYYRFSGRDGYGIQRLYSADGRSDQTLRVTDGDLILVREGYHPFVAAPGYDAYYLNTLAGSDRSMAATDDPRYAHLRASWPPPDPRVPMIPHPAAASTTTG